MKNKETERINATTREVEVVVSSVLSLKKNDERGGEGCGAGRGSKTTLDVSFSYRNHFIIISFEFHCLRLISSV